MYRFLQVPSLGRVGGRDTYECFHSHHSHTTPFDPAVSDPAVLAALRRSPSSALDHFGRPSATAASFRAYCGRIRGLIDGMDGCQASPSQILTVPGASGRYRQAITSGNMLMSSAWQRRPTPVVNTCLDTFFPGFGGLDDDWDLRPSS